VPGLVVRPAQARDVERAGDVNFLAFYRSALLHGVPAVVTTPAESRRYVSHLLEFDPLGGIVAEDGGEVVGLAWLHPRGPVATVGPVAVDPAVQGRGIGRRLLEGLFEIAGKGVPQIRLVQESFNLVSLGLYLRTGFRIVAPLLELELPAGTRLDPPPATASVVIRPARADDRTALVTRDARAFGAPRPQSVDLYLQRGRVLVAEERSMLAGYAMAIGFDARAFLGSASADDARVLLALLGTLAAEFGGRGLAVRALVAASDRAVVDGLLGFGFRVFRACHYMVRGGGTAPPPSYVLMNGDMM
jgi:ribosomal protein S18 acetylase RimI-like enzyme